MIQPIKNCYWVVPGRLLAGEYPRNIPEELSQEKLNDLLRCGVTVFIDLTEENELDPYSAMIGEASHYRFPIRDQSIPKSIDATTAILDAIDQHIGDGHLVYVHCWGGIGRTGLVIGCWLARHGFRGEEALVRLRQLWQECPKSAFRSSPETGEQIQYVRNWGIA